MAIFVNNGPVIRKNDIIKINFPDFFVEGKVYDCNQVETADSSDMEYQNIVETMSNILMFDPIYKNYKTFSYIIVSLLNSKINVIKQLPCKVNISLKKVDENNNEWIDLGSHLLGSFLVRSLSEKSMETLYGIVLQDIK